MARVDVRLEGLSDVVRQLERLPEELHSKGGNAIRASVRAGGQVIARQMQANIDAIIAEPNKDGRDVSTGLLRSSIRVRRRKMAGGKKGEAYLVGPTNRVYPKGQRVQAVGAMLEFGTSKRRPMPWAEPAYLATRDEAARVIVETARARLERLFARYQRGR